MYKAGGMSAARLTAAPQKVAGGGGRAMEGRLVAEGRRRHAAVVEVRCSPGAGQLSGGI